MKPSPRPPSNCPHCGSLRELCTSNGEELIVRCAECHTIKEAFPYPVALLEE